MLNGFIYKIKINMKESKTIIEYFDGEKVQKGIVDPRDQKPGIKNYNKVFIRLVNDNLEFIKDKNGKKLCTLKEQNQIQTIGFIN